MWGLPNTGVDKLRSFLECFAISRMIRWLGLLGRCVGASYHAGFCCGCAIYSGCVLGTFDCVQLHFTLYDHDVAVVMIVILP